MVQLVMQAALFLHSDPHAYYFGDWHLFLVNIATSTKRKLYYYFL